MTVEVALLISIISVGFSIFFGIKSSKRTDTKDIEERVARDTRTDITLNQIVAGVNDIKYDIGTVKKDLQSHSKRITSVEKSVDKANVRIDSIMDVLDMRGGSNGESEENNSKH